MVAGGIARTGEIQAADRAQLQQMLDALVASGALGALAQFRDEGGTWNGVSGVADVGNRRPAAAGGRFRVGSVTKTFTATVMLQLAGEARLGLDDTVERWLPGLVVGGGRITLRHLLDHMSMTTASNSRPATHEILASISSVFCP